MIFIKKFHIFEKKKFFLFYFIEFFKCYYCSINLKRQSEYSGLRPDTSSLVSLFMAIDTDIFEWRILKLFHDLFFYQIAIALSNAC